MQDQMVNPAGLFATLVIRLLMLLGIGARYHHHRGDLNVIRCLLSLFFPSNLVICYWEICIFLRRDDIEARVQYWRRRQRHISRGELYIYIGALNAPWVLFAILGAYVSLRLILDANYSVLGY